MPTRAEVVTLTEELLDAVGSARYSTTLKLRALDTVHDRGWRRILAANRTYRLNRVPVTTDADGRVALADLTTGTGDDTRRFYKAIEAAQGTIFYRPVNDQSNPLGVTVIPTALAYAFWREGEHLQFAPAQSGVSLTIAVNDLPQAPSALADDTSVVVWPEGYEWILAAEAASLLAGKGAAEVGAALFHKDQADELWQDLLADVQRFSTDPLTQRASDDAHEWGSL